jgi:hypothetical protein
VQQSGLSSPGEHAFLERQFHPKRKGTGGQVGVAAVDAQKIFI